MTAGLKHVGAKRQTRKGNKRRRWNVPIEHAPYRIGRATSQCRRSTDPDRRRRSTVAAKVFSSESERVEPVSCREMAILLDAETPKRSDFLCLPWWVVQDR